MERILHKEFLRRASPLVIESAWVLESDRLGFKALPFLVLAVQSLAVIGFLWVCFLTYEMDKMKSIHRVKVKYANTRKESSTMTGLL